MWKDGAHAWGGGGGGISLKSTFHCILIVHRNHLYPNYLIRTQYVWNMKREETNIKKEHLLNDLLVIILC